MSAIKTWKVTYAPANEPNSGEERFFTGTAEQRDKWFFDTVMCAACQRMMVEGESFYEADGTLAFRSEPETNPWATGCGCEWDLEEAA